MPGQDTGGPVVVPMRNPPPPLPLKKKVLSHGRTFVFAQGCVPILPHGTSKSCNQGLLVNFPCSAGTHLGSLEEPHKKKQMIKLQQHVIPKRVSITKWAHLEDQICIHHLQITAEGTFAQDFNVTPWSSLCWQKYTC